MLFRSGGNQTKPDIVLSGNGTTLVFNTSYNPAPGWTHYDVLLREDAGWKVGNLSGPAPTVAEFKSVLSQVTNLEIRGEYYQNNVDEDGLDNVILDLYISIHIHIFIYTPYSYLPPPLHPQKAPKKLPPSLIFTILLVFS